MRLRFAVAIPLLLFVALSSGQTMSHEEQVVRTTYVRLSYAMQVREVHRAIADAKEGKEIDQTTLSQRLKNVELTFVLSDFKIGNVTDDDIGRTRYADLVTKPSGDSLDITHGYSTFGTDSPADGSAIPQQTQSIIAFAEWHRSQTINEDWEQPWGKIFPQIENSGWFSRYASFKVKVSFQGRSREYRAMFLFGRNPTTGGEYIIPGDTIAGLTGALHFFATNNAYPEALIEGGVGRDVPAVHEWLKGQAVTGKTHDDNCDPGTGKCGVSRQDLEKLEKLPSKHVMKALPPRVPNPRLLNVSFSPRPPVFNELLQSTATDCTKYNTTNPHTGFIQEFSRHVNPGDNSNHTLVDLAQTSCAYSDGTSSTCNTQCNVSVSNSSIGDTGPVTGFCHSVDKATKNDTQSGTGSGADCGGGVGGGVKECPGCFCGVTVSISSNGASVSISSDGFFTANDGLGQRCAAQSKPTPSPTPTPTNDPPPPPDPGGCNNVGGGGFSPVNGGAGDDGCSPIIIDFGGKGFLLTSAADGVQFDISGTGRPIRLGWIASGAANAFLVLDRNGNGVIDNGTELFGNFTPQSSSPRPNGFLALAVYDKPENGGNGDGIIDARDQIFNSLRLWVDANHDGISQPEELHTLPEMGVFSISLGYSFSSRTDEFGNVFRYRGKINQDQRGESDVGKKIYDVFFVTR